MPKTDLSETGVLNFRSVLGGMTLLLVGSLSTVVAANPAQAAFSFVQENYQVPGLGYGNRYVSAGFGPSIGRMDGAFEGSDFNGDGTITCLRGGSCEVTSLRTNFAFTAQGTEVRYNPNTNRDGEPIPTTFSSGLGGTFSPGSMTNSNTFDLSYTLADPLSLRINANSFGDMRALAISSGSSSVSGYLPGIMNYWITTTANSPVIVSGDSTAAPEPATIAGLLLAGGVGAWLKRRTPRGRGLVASSQ
jgi:hypothetical protein